MNCCSKFKDVNTFGNMLLSNTFPLPNSIQYDGFFNCYFYPFENNSNDNKNNKDLINADISYSIQRNPVNLKDELFISLLLKSQSDGIKKIFKSLDIVVILDVSGSMSSFLQTNKTSQGSCLNLAKDAIKKLLGKLESLEKNTGEHGNPTKDAFGEGKKIHLFYMFFLSQKLNKKFD